MGVSRCGSVGVLSAGFWCCASVITVPVACAMVVESGAGVTVVIVEGVPTWWVPIALVASSSLASQGLWFIGVGLSSWWYCLVPGRDCITWVVLPVIRGVVVLLSLWLHHGDLQFARCHQIGWWPNAQAWGQVGVP